MESHFFLTNVMNMNESWVDEGKRERVKERVRVHGGGGVLLVHVS